MGQPQEDGRPPNTYDPENDQVLKMLEEQSHRSKMNIPVWAWIGIVLGIVAVIYVVWLVKSEEAAKPAPTAIETTVEVEPPAPPPPTPLELATEWRNLTLSGSKFEGLEVRERDGAFYLEYRARSGDAIPKVVNMYRELFPDEGVPVLDRATTFHKADYGRGLWVGDSIFLLIPPQSE